MIFKVTALFKKTWGDLLFFLVLFGNLWIWKALSFSFPIFFLLIITTIFTYRLIKGRGRLQLFLFFLLLLIFSQWKTTTPTSLTNLANDDIRLRDQRLKEYPPVYLKVGSKTLWIPVGHWFEERKESIVYLRLSRNFSEVIDPNLYFFANHPRERVGVTEFEKFPYIFLPFFVLGFLSMVERKSCKLFFLSFFFSVAVLTTLGGKSPLGTFAIFPFLVTLTALGVEVTYQKMKLHWLTPVVSSPLASSEQNPPKRKTLRIHPRTFVRGFLRRRIKTKYLKRLALSLN